MTAPNTKPPTYSQSQVGTSGVPTFFGVEKAPQPLLTITERKLAVCSCGSWNRTRQSQVKLRGFVITTRREFSSERFTFAVSGPRLEKT
ncbi:hypothetical protein GEV33_014685 [Tenebrio molitor]|uniref:Uncharacterized protein n=1 Tax=Tenebrio molitor TaxID=7067 RepID=A0A8J6H531_TENMO|nr:hypothetical protein GEV33_014685 [Tenebrio molitor]